MNKKMKKKVTIGSDSCVLYFFNLMLIANVFTIATKVEIEINDIRIGKF